MPIIRNILGQFAKGSYSGGSTGKHWKLSKINRLHQSIAQSGLHRPNSKPPVMIGNKNPQFKKGKYIDSKGYYLVLCYNHPFATKRNKIGSGYVRNSRLVAEKCLGRYLSRIEVVHHIDRDTLNDNPANLYVFPSQTEHREYHKLKYPITSNLIDLA